MNHDILKEVIFDQHEIIKKTKIVPRDYVELENQHCYIKL